MLAEHDHRDDAGQHDSQSRPNGVADAQVHRDEGLSQQSKAQQIAHDTPYRRQKNSEPLRSLHHGRGEYLAAYGPNQQYISHLFVPFVLHFAQLLLKFVEDPARRHAHLLGGAPSPTAFAHSPSMRGGSAIVPFAKLPLISK